MHIAFIGKFNKLHDEEYIARSFEMIGHRVTRIPQISHWRDIERVLLKEDRPDIILYPKWERPKELDVLFGKLRREGTKTVCWLFDLYFDYSRQNQVKEKNYFRSDYVFTTDEGHTNKWDALGINHQCVRQGIWQPECYMVEPNYKYDVIFVGSFNPSFPRRQEIMEELEKSYNFKWFGRDNTDEVRGEALNRLFARAKIVVGDSVHSPRYWSNRVVETLGRGGFLIHRNVSGIKEIYPYIVTYDGSTEDLKSKIDYYLTHDEEREKIRQDNFEWVKNRYTMDKMCAELISKL